MAIRHRPMCPSDVRPCVDIIASVAAARRRYGEALADLYPAWLRLLNYEAKSAVVVEEIAGGRTTLCAIGVSVFVRDDFIRKLKARPFWYGPELARRLRRGDSPLLSEREMAETNSGGGMNALVWEGRACPGYETNWEVYRRLTNAFLEEHRGYLWKEVICCEMETPERLMQSIQMGGLLWDPVAGRYTDGLKEKDAATLLQAPHVVGLTRELEMQRPGSWMGGLFEYKSPRFGFTRSQQRLLLASLDGRIDQELSDELGISLFTVKKMWRQIYERVAACSPELIPANSAADNGNGASERGPGKKLRLIGYLRDHREELRPLARKRPESNGSPERRLGAP